MITFESLDIRSHFRTSAISSGNKVKFVYAGHWVKVKVTGARKVELCKNFVPKFAHTSEISTKVAGGWLLFVFTRYIIVHQCSLC